MKGGLGIWAAGIATSALLHIGAGVGLLAALEPDPVQDQPQQESRLNVVAQEVTRSTADEKAPTADAVETGETSGASLSSGAIAQSQARPLVAPVQSAVSPDPPAETATARNPAGQTAEPQTPPVQSAAAQNPPVQAQPAVALQDRTAPTAAAVLASAPVAPLVPALPATVPSDPKPEIAVSSEIAADLLAPDRPPAILSAETSPRLTPSASVAPPSIATAEKEPEVLATKAVLAFPGEDSNIDPKSLAAFQSFTQPGSASATDLRDGLSAALSLPCARMQVIFDPEAATLRLTGHVPENDMRAPLLSKLRGRMGADIAISDDLLILPAPQCTALTGIANVGLPQSTDQITNPLIVGEDTHARAFRYLQGDALVLDMTGADYPAYVYVDYFDAAGNVIHLTPNDRAPLQRVDAKAPIQIGARGADEPGLFVRIGPPYGQEIAAAFAASVPLYDGLRPLVEPADAYLQWMQERVAEARAQHPDFKGEWVYFFVTTAPQ